jgi:hypothetical protein
MRQRRVELPARERAAADQEISDLLGGLRPASNQAHVLADVAARRENADLAIVARQLESALQRLLVGASLQGDFEAQVASFGVHLRGGRDRVEQGDLRDNLAQLLQITNERQRIHAVFERRGPKPQGEVPWIRSSPRVLIRPASLVLASARLGLLRLILLQPLK